MFSQHLEKLSSCLGGTPFWQSFFFHAKIKEKKNQLIFSSELSLNLVQDKLETQILWLIDFVILIVASVAYYHNTRGRKKNRLLVITITSSNEKNSWGKKIQSASPWNDFQYNQKRIHIQTTWENIKAEANSDTREAHLMDGCRLIFVTFWDYSGEIISY